VNGSAVRIKICGLTRIDEAHACLDAGADWIGINFHLGSPRYVQPDCAREIIASLGCPSRIVGVFVNRPPSEVAEQADSLGLQLVQLHGDEPPEDLLALSRFRIIRAFRLGGLNDIRAMNDYLDRAASLGRPPYAVLVDARVEGIAGGTGVLVAEDLLRLIPFIPRLILAGGLRPDNVADGIARSRPWMVDVASGVESSPGHKDSAKVQAFVQAVRSVRSE
jgi:phosphoribosylanthranilate isomerase